ncbi:MAG TPA: amidophosphoribosyltransferase [Anaerolineae bacterium]|nr:amidophosphoribosyltransferase [Anaerolineae bacterium]
MAELIFADNPSEECGVFGIYAPGRDVARLTFFGLYALQHRGQEGAGIASSDGKAAYIHKGTGLVTQVFNEDNLRPLKGHLAIGHNRYSTTGAPHVRNVQPYLIETLHGPLGVAHNGNLTNALDLRKKLLERGVGLSSSSDTEVITQMLAAPANIWANGHTTTEVKDEPDRWVARLRAFMQLSDGAYSIAVLTRDALYAVRDPYGLRPLCLGELPEGGHVVASESCALLTVGARYLREIEPGEIVRLDEAGVASYLGRPALPRALCIFEYVYFARPDSMLEGQVVHTVRQKMGRQLAREAPAEADIVVGVPDSATPAAIGYSMESGLPYTEGLIKNRYIGRTFIEPDDNLRKAGVKLKYNPLTANLEGKRVVLVDDSIVRGNTAGPLVQLIRDGGAREVHVRVSSPPVRHPCFMGVDMATRSQLIGHRLDVEGIRQKIGADTLAYLSLEGLTAAVQDSLPQSRTHCNACFSGHYPLPIPEWLFDEDREKLIFEEMWG